MMFRGIVCLLCFALVMCGDRNKPDSKEDFAEMFKENPEQGSDQKTMLLGTTRVADAFDDTGMLRSEFSDLMTDAEATRLKEMRDMQCPDGSKVFSLGTVALADAMKAAEELEPLMTSGSGGTDGSGHPGGNVGDGLSDRGGNASDSQQGQMSNLQTPNQDLGFKPVACWSGNKTALEQALSSFTDDKIKKVFNPKLLALLSDQVAQKMSPLLSDKANQLLCDELKDADSADIKTVAKQFPCKDQLKEIAKDDPRLADTLLRQELEDGVEHMTDSEWDTMLDDYGKATPRDIIEKVPEEKIKDKFAELWDKDKADVLVDKVDFTTVNASFVSSLGHKICELPTSSLLKIPTSDLKSDLSALSCLKEEKDKSKRRKVAEKLLGNRDPTKCKEFLKEVDPTDEKCWKELSDSDLRDFDFSTVDPSDMEEISCETAKEVKDKLGLGKVSDWTSEQVHELKWLLRCLGPSDLDSADVDKMAAVMADGSTQTDADLPPTLKRKVMKKMKENLKAGGSLDADKLTKMRGVLGAMTSSDVEELTSDVVNDVLPTLQKEFKKMDKAARGRLVRKLDANQMKNHLCQLDDMAGDIPADMLAAMTDLGTVLADVNCTFRCRNQEQCAAVYAHVNKTLTSAGGWTEVSRDFLDRARDTGAMCGMPLEEVTQLQPETNFFDVASAFFNSECENPTVTQLFSDKLRLFMEFVSQQQLGVAEVAQLGGDYFKNLDVQDLNAYTAETKTEIFHALGQADLDDVDTQRVKDMAAAAVSAKVTAGADVDEVAVLFLGNLACGLDASHVNRMTSSAVSDALPKLSECPDVSEETQRAGRQAMMDKMSVDYATMDAADLSLGGTLLLSDCDNMDKIPDATKNEAMGDLAQAAQLWKDNRQRRNDRWRDPASGDKERQDKMQSNIRCGLTKVLEAKARVRVQNSGGARRKRATAAFTCDDIRLLGEEAVILNELDIAAISDTDFTNCADVLGSVTDWSQAQKDALATKAKQAWGAVTTWATDDRLLTAGAIAQGLTPAELSSMTITLQDLEQLGQHANWTPEQLAAMFNTWLNSDSTVNGNVASLTSSHLQQLGHIVCGATPTQISGISPSVYSGAMGEIGDAEGCSSDQLKAWAALATQALGSVTSWTLAQTAAVDHVLAGLQGSDLSQLSSSQLSVMDLNTFASIPPQEFASLTVIQLQSLSTQHALSTTQAQLSVLNPAQQAALKELGVSIVVDNSANGMTITMGTLMALTAASLTIIYG